MLHEFKSDSIHDPAQDKVELADGWKCKNEIVWQQSSTCSVRPIQNNICCLME